MTMMTVEAIKSLRLRTGAGMMDCKKALQEAGGNEKEASRILRVKGLAKSSSRSSRTASQGSVLLKVKEDKTMAGILEINCETDFVANSNPFQDILKECLKCPLSSWRDQETFLGHEIHGRSMDDMIKEQGALMGENIVLRRATLLAPRNAYVVSYLHGVRFPCAGRIAIILAFKGDKSMEERMRKIAMHIASAKPLVVRADDLDARVIEAERDVVKQQALESGKPESIIEKIIDGRVKKFIQSSCLLGQNYVFDPDKTVEEILTLWNKDAIEPLELLSFEHFSLGSHD